MVRTPSRDGELDSAYAGLILDPPLGNSLQ